MSHIEIGLGGDLVKVLSWYDNEWGYVTTLIKYIQNVTGVMVQ